MGTADIQAAIDAIPAKKEDLRKAFEDLQSYASFFSSFTLQWKDIDDHFSSIETSIEKKFRELAEKVAPAKHTAEVSKANMQLVEIRSALKSLCVKMDANGLLSYVLGNRLHIDAIRRELAPAILCSPDPVTMVLDSFEGCERACEITEESNTVTLRAYLIILACFHELKLNLKPSDKEKARRVAKKCNALISSAIPCRGAVTIVFLQLIVTFGLIEYYEIDVILHRLVTVARKKGIVDLCRNSVLEEKIPDLIDMLNKMGRQMDSVKFILAFDLQDRFPLASLFKAFIKESSNGLRKDVPKFEAIKKKLSFYRAVSGTVKQYNLGFLYPNGSLQKRIQKLEKQMLEADLGQWAFQKDQKKKLHEPLNKQPRLSDSSAADLPPYPNSHTQHQLEPLNSAPTLLPLHMHSQNQPHLVLAEQPPYTGLASPYGLIAAPPVYEPGVFPARPNSYLYPTSGSSHYARPVPYNGYTNPGFP